MVAALVLGYFSYQAAAQLAEKSEKSVERSNRALGLKLIDRIEKVIIDSDRTFFRLVSLDDPREFRELWRRIVRISPAVESVIVLNNKREVVHLVAKLRPHQLSSFRKRFLKHILPDMELEKLAPNKHKHLHMVYAGKTYVLSYIRRRSAGHDYYVALSIDIHYLIHDIFPEEFKELEETNSIAVFDEQGRALYGRPVSGGDRLTFQDRFPTTLYKWRLQISPRQIGSLSQQAWTRQLSDVALVGSAVGVIWVGMLVLLVAVRKEQRANQLKSEFISNVSHELKTPLSLIRLFGELLASGRSKDEATSQEYAEIITRESDRLTGLIDNVLDFARIERGKAAYEMAEGDLGPVVERAVDLCRYRSEQAGVHLTTDIQEGVPRTTFDESAMTLVLLNLLDNALKYGATKGDEVKVTLTLADNALLLGVSDPGPGIPPDEVQQIFERFSRGKSARSMGQRGSGIGLSLVKHIAESHGGRVSVESELGKGATFEVSIPARSSG